MNTGIARSLVFTGLIATLAVGAPYARCQVFGSDSHSVRVSVAPISLVSITSGTVSLGISSAVIVPGQDQITMTDQSSGLSWGINSANRKITVSTNLGAPLYQLRLAAINPTRGTASAEFTVGTVARDLITNVGRSTGSCTLRYTGVALASQGTGTDVHVITFTVQTQ